MKIEKPLLIKILGIALGLIGGYLYWYFIGCSSGTCTLTSNWHNSTLIGGIMGYLISDTFKQKHETKIAKDE